MTARALTVALGGLLCAAAVLAGLSATPAEAATHTVTLGTNALSPAKLTVARGDTVRFTNGDNVSHTITRTSGAWTFTATIAAGKSATTSVFTSSSTYGYHDDVAAAGVRSRSGSIVVPATSAAAAGGPRYAGKSGVVQDSAHRYGLPVALAVVAVTGSASLLARLLLAEPAARRRRTGPESAAGG